LSENSLKIIFAGTPDFASVALEALFNTSHEIVAVYTQQDRPSGRGLKIKHSPVKELALQYQLPLFQPASLKDIYEQERLANFNADVMVVAAYGMLLPSAVLHTPRLGCVNIHPSLLPRWRGAAPIQRTIQAGDSITGVTIMQMDEGLDTGPILLQRQYVLEPDETSQSLHDEMAKLGAVSLVETLNLLAQGLLEPKPQDNATATYAHKISKEEALLDWNLPASELEWMIRAFNPWPVAHTTWHNQHLRIWSAKAIDQTHQMTPRTIVYAGEHGVDVAAGKGVLRLQKVQLPGGKVMDVKDFYHARQQELKVGEHFI